jgi:glycosyltransferase involved in cell wall biosynthesis
MPARLRLNVFSPLPPLRSEICNHTLTVMTALRELAEVTLWTPQDPVSETAEHTGDCPVVHYDPARMDWARLNRADANIYNIGNNATFHRAIFDIARQAPGIIVLHDTRLQHFFARYGLDEGPDRAFYLECMRRTHGPAAAADAERWLAQEQPLDVLVDRYPLTVAALDGALAAVVHNTEEHRALLGQTRTPVFHLPLASPVGPLPERRPPNGTLRLLVFGFLGPNRRLGPIIDAVGALPDRDVRLDIYGALDDPEPIDAQIAASGLVGRVRRHGFVPESELRIALARADLAINLRYPSMGEASASQLRIWEAALPSLVTRTGWYATLPEDAVFFVEPDREAETLRQHLEALRQNPAAFRQAGLRGRAVLEADHTPERYATGLLDIIAQSPTLHSRRNAIALSRHVATEMLAMAGAGGLALCADDIATAVAGLAKR